MKRRGHALLQPALDVDIYSRNQHPTRGVLRTRHAAGPFQVVRQAETVGLLLVRLQSALDPFTQLERGDPFYILRRRSSPGGSAQRTRQRIGAANYRLDDHQESGHEQGDALTCESP